MISVDDLSTKQIRRLRTYLQTITSEEREETTPSPTVVHTVVTQAESDSPEQTTPKADDRVSDSVMQQMLRKFTEQSVKQGEIIQLPLVSVSTGEHKAVTTLFSTSVAYHMQNH